MAGFVVVADGKAGDAATREIIHETSGDINSSIEIVDCGVLSAIEWLGSVSAKGFIESGLTDSKTLDEAARRIDEFYVKANLLAKTRCIDGRHDPNLDESNLGPQVIGGAPGAAFAYRLGVDDDQTRGSFLQDAQAMIESYIRMGFSPGGHRDKNSQDQKNVGCGAIDGMDQILAAMINPELVNDHNRVTRLLLGDDFDPEAYFRVMGAANMVNGRTDEYFRGREAVIDLLEKRSKDSTATLEGEHQEGLVAVNLVPGTTLSSNRFYDSFGGIQAFGYDLWWSVEIANRLMPRSEDAQKRQRFVMARVMTTVATLMALTDGTQRLVIRMPSPESEMAEDVPPPQP